MESPTHSLNNLFGQLGLSNSDAAINDFINKHKSIPGEMPLYKASFWTDSQAAFLHEAIEEDADWAEIVDHLDVMLR